MISVLLVYAFVGALAGLLAGLFGIGGGLVIVPLLDITFNWQAIPQEHMMHLALGTSVASICFTSVSSFRAHNKRGAVDWTIFTRIVIGVLIGSFAGSYIAALLSTSVLKIIFVVFLYYVATQMILNKKPKPTRQMPGFVATSSAGGIIGVISNLVGIGGGVLSVPYMLWHNVPLHRAVGTAAAIGFPIAVAGATGYIINGLGATNVPDYTLGFVYLPALAGIVAISVFVAPYGAKLAHSLPVDRLKRLFAVLLYIVATRMLLSAL